jgi:hypothetical protein
LIFRKVNGGQNWGFTLKLRKIDKLGQFMFKYGKYTTIAKNSFVNDRANRVFFLFSAIFNILIWILLGWQVKSFPELIPLHYNIYYGIDLYGSWNEIFILPAAGLIILLVNYPAAFFLYNKHKILSYFLVGAGFLLTVYLFLAATAIILINS